MIHLRAQNKGLAFSFEIAPDVPALVVGDEKRLSQVLLNLLGNAVKFTDRGSVTLKIENCQLNSENYRGEEGHHQSSIFQPVSGQASILQFSITDTGPGIPEDQRENIFSPFVQIGDHTRKRKGTGLGLAISRQLVRLMGGELEVASRAGQGSTFWFEIPLLLQAFSR